MSGIISGGANMIGGMFGGGAPDAGGAMGDIAQAGAKLSAQSNAFNTAASGMALNDSVQSTMTSMETSKGMAAAKLANDLNDATNNFTKAIGASAKSASQ
jgi:hypothetical protein